MNDQATKALVVGLLMATSLAGAVAAEDEAETGSLLFVVSTTSGHVDGATLTIDQPASVIWFTDRPQRQAGHITPADLAERWTGDRDSFAALPPNAVLSRLDGGTTANSVIELTDISTQGGDLTFDFALLEGDLPEGRFRAASLFIDATCGSAGCDGGDGGILFGDGGTGGAGGLLSDDGGAG